MMTRMMMRTATRGGSLVMGDFWPAKWSWLLYTCDHGLSKWSGVLGGLKYLTV